MQKPLSFDRLQQDMPNTVGKIIERARASNSRRFDATTDPATWTWSVDWAEREPVLPEGEDPKDVEKNWDDLRVAGAEPYVRARIAQRAMMPSLRLKTGPTAIMEPITADGELPSEWTATFALKTYEPLPWSGATITLFQPNHLERPGLADAAVFAGYETSSGGAVLLAAEGHQDRTLKTLWAIGLDNGRRVATMGGVIPQDEEWDVAVGATATMGDEKWRRLSNEDVLQRLGNTPWVRVDSRATLDAQTLLGLSTGRDPSRKKVSNDLDTITADTIHWPVGAARSDADILASKWASAVAKAVAVEAAGNQPPSADGSAPSPEQVAEKPKKPTTVAGSVKANDPEALLEALAKNAANGIDLADNEHTQPMSTLLLTAAAKAGPRVMEILLEHGANPKHRSKSNATLSSTAVTNENVDNMLWLHSKGLFVSHESNGNGDTLFMQALEAGRFKAAEALLTMGSTLNDSNLFTNTALHQAASTGNGPAVQWLIEHRADPNRENFQGAIAEEMVPNELPEMIDALADYRFAFDAGKEYTLPTDFQASLRNKSKHPSMAGADGAADGGSAKEQAIAAAAAAGVDLQGLEGVTAMSGDAFKDFLKGVLPPEDPPAAPAPARPKP